MSIKIVKGPFSSFDERDFARLSALNITNSSFCSHAPSAMIFEAQTSNTEIFVAKDGDYIVGWAMAYIFQGHQIVNVFVDRRRRKEGIATSLLSNFDSPFIIFADEELSNILNSRYNNYDISTINDIAKSYHKTKLTEICLWSERFCGKLGLEISFFEDGRRDQIKDEISAINLKWSENGLL
jgi:hypothetical protein